MSNRIQLETVDSTNAYALANFADLPGHTLVTAEQQSAGRGRRGKKWFSPPGTNIYASFIVKNPIFPPHCASWIGCLSALETLRLHEPDINFWIKWPNDIYAGKEICESRKIAGVLCETRTRKTSNQLDGIVIGIGININMSNEDLKKIPIPAASLFSLSEKVWPVEDIITTLHRQLIRLSSLDNLGGSLSAQKRATRKSHLHEADRTIGINEVRQDFRRTNPGENELFRLWNENNRLRGQEITVLTENGNEFTGILESFDHNGGIVVRSGTIVKKLHSGDISINCY